MNVRSSMMVWTKQKQDSEEIMLVEDTIPRGLICMGISLGRRLRDTFHITCHLPSYASVEESQAVYPMPLKVGNIWDGREKYLTFSKCMQEPMISHSIGAKSHFNLNINVM